jgi:ribosomal protein S18 acetylase RimI-like enzyme
MEIRKYTDKDEAQLFNMLRSEGEEWIDYHGEKTRNNYKKALGNSMVYVAFKDNVLCGYTRCKYDDGFGIYVYDLLVSKEYRGNNIGRSLVEKICADYPEDTIYVMSDVDGYYQKLGYSRVGSVFMVEIKS